MVFWEVCFGVFRVFGGVSVFNVGFRCWLWGVHFGLARTKKTTRNGTWGSILTLCRRKCSKQPKIKVWTKNDAKS